MKKIILASLVVALSVFFVSSIAFAADAKTGFGLKLGYTVSGGFDVDVTTAENSYVVGLEYKMPFGSDDKSYGSIRLMAAPKFSGDHSEVVSVAGVPLATLGESIDVALYTLSYNYIRRFGMEGTGFYAGAGLGYGTASADGTITCTDIVAGTCAGAGVPAVSAIPSNDDNKFIANLIAGYEMANGFSAEVMYQTNNSIVMLNLGYAF